MVTLEDVKNNEEVKELIVRSAATVKCFRLYRTFNKAYYNSL